MNPRGLYTDPTLELLPTASCSCGSRLAPFKIHSYLTDEFRVSYDEALELAYQARKLGDVFEVAFEITKNELEKEALEFAHDAREVKLNKATLELAYRLREDKLATKFYGEMVDKSELQKNKLEKEALELVYHAREMHTDEKVTSRLKRNKLATKFYKEMAGNNRWQYEIREKLEKNKLEREALVLANRAREMKLDDETLELAYNVRKSEIAMRFFSNTDSNFYQKTKDKLEKEELDLAKETDVDDKILDLAHQLTENALAVKFYRRMSRDVEKEHKILQGQNPIERAFNELNYRPCCRKTALSYDVLSTAKTMSNPEIESGDVDMGVVSKKLSKKYEGHMKKGQLLEPRFENGVWYADSVTQIGITSYSRAPVVSWLEVPVPAFAQNILKKVNPNATSVILPKIATQPDAWNKRSAGDSHKFTSPIKEQVVYLAYKDKFPNFREYVSNYMLREHRIDERIFEEVHPSLSHTSNYAHLINSALQRTGNKEEAFHLVKQDLPDFADEEIRQMIYYYTMTRYDFDAMRMQAIENYRIKNNIDEEQSEKYVSEMLEKLMEEQQSYEELRKNKRLWPEIAEFM